MKKKIAVAIVATFLTFNSSVYALSEYAPPVNGEELCFGEDIMKEVVKETINTVGKHLLDKYLGPDSMNYYQNNNNNNSNNNNANSSNNNNNNNNQTQVNNNNTNNNSNNNSTTSNNSTVQNSGISVYEEEEEMIIIK